MSACPGCGEEAAHIGVKFRWVDNAKPRVTVTHACGSSLCEWDEWDEPGRDLDAIYALVAKRMIPLRDEYRARKNREGAT